MKIAFRVDAGLEIGAGHVMRCLRLADHLRKNFDIEAFFFCRALKGHMIEWIEAAGHRCIPLVKQAGKDTMGAGLGSSARPLPDRWLTVPWQVDVRETSELCRREGVDAVVVDHFGIEKEWESMLASTGDLPIVVIDGQGERSHYCDMLIDPTYSLEGPGRWRDLVPAACAIYSGPQYHFLSEDYRRARHQREKEKAGSDAVARILTCFGGIDRHNATSRVVGAIKGLSLPGIHLDVLTGAQNPNIRCLERELTGLEDVSIHVQPESAAQVMALADVYIGAAGSMIWEYCYLGVPVILISTAGNQERQARILADAGAACYLGRLAEVGTTEIQRAVGWSVDNAQETRAMADSARRLLNDSPFQALSCVGNHVVRLAGRETPAKSSGERLSG